jgi:hypothetical protein
MSKTNHIILTESNCDRLNYVLEVGISTTEKKGLGEYLLFDHTNTILGYITDRPRGRPRGRPNLGRGKRADFAIFKCPPGGHFAARHTNPLGDASASEMHHRAAIGACLNWEGISKMSRLAMFGKYDTKIR